MRELAAWLLVAGLVLLALAPPVAAQNPELIAVPQPSLDNLETAVQEQLAQQRQRLDSALQAEQTAAQDLAELFGNTGRLYLFYDRDESARACFSNAIALQPEEFRWWYYRATIDQEAGQFDAALEGLAKAHEIRPADLATLLRFADLRFRRREYPAAEELYRRALAAEPNSAAAYFGLGRVAHAGKNSELAIAHLTKALELQPDANSIYHPLAMAYRRAGDMDQAKQAISQAGNNAPTFDEPLLRELFDLSVTARSFVIEGNRARRRGLLQLAVDNYYRALDLDPQEPTAHYNLGVMLAESGRAEQAEGHFRAAIAADPDYGDAHFNLAIGLRDRGDTQSALKHFGRAAELDPNDLGASLEYAILLHFAGRSAEARQRLQAVRAAQPREPQVLLQLVRYFDAVGDPAAANAVLTDAEAAMAKAEDQASLKLLQAERAMARADRSTAARLFEEAITIAPEDLASRLAWAGFLARAGRFPQAAEQYTRAAEISPANEEAALGKAAALCLTGRFAEAIAGLEASFEILPESPRVADTLAKALATAPDPKLRDGVRALELAQRLASANAQPEYAETVAMALAASGRFDDAAAQQQKLLSGAQGSAPPRIVARLRSNLSRYENGQIALPPF